MAELAPGRGGEEEDMGTTTGLTSHERVRRMFAREDQDRVVSALEKKKETE